METATLYRTEGTALTISPSNGKNFNLQELYKWLGCEMIEVLNLPNLKGQILICDEEALCNGNNIVNRRATEVYRKAWDSDEVGVVGDAILCPSKMLR